MLCDVIDICWIYNYEFYSWSMTSQLSGQGGVPRSGDSPQSRYTIPRSATACQDQYCLRKKSYFSDITAMVIGRDAYRNPHDDLGYLYNTSDVFSITLTPYMVLPLFATRFAAYAGGIRVSFIQPCLFEFDIKCSAWEIYHTYLYGWNI